MKQPEQSVLAQVTNLQNLSIKELHDMWQRLYGTAATTSRNRSYLQTRLAYRIQELEFAKTNPTLLASNQSRIDSMIEHLKPLAKVRRKKVPYKLLPGTRLERDFQGKTHVVCVQSDGTFEYMGRPFANLTAISHQITGQKWSGPSFFGLTRKNPAVVEERG